MREYMGSTWSVTGLAEHVPWSPCTRVHTCTCKHEHHTHTHTPLKIANEYQIGRTDWVWDQGKWEAVRRRVREGVG